MRRGISGLEIESVGGGILGGSMSEAGWRGHTEQGYHVALFVRDKFLQHDGISEEERAMISEVLSLLAVYH